jgi:predicted negative regulator of RcsB-dependent stress response
MMGLRSKLALFVLASLGAASILPEATPAQQAPASVPRVGKAERAAIAALQNAIAAHDYATAAGALATAQQTATSDDARYYTALLQFRLARETNNAAMQANATEALIAMGRMPQAQLGGLYALQGTGALSARDRARADTAYTRAMELAPSPEIALTLAQLRINGHRNAEAVALIDRAIQLQKARGQPVPESWYRRAVELSVVGTLAPQTMKFSRDWISAYPSPENWRDVVLTYRDIAKPDPAALVDVIRLQRLAKGLDGERDYMDAAQSFTAAGLPGEAKSVLDEGVAAHMVDPVKPASKAAILAATRAAAAARAKLTALRRAGTVDAGDQLLSFGDYAAAAEAYQAALQKAPADANLVNTRLGIALALADRRAEAATAFGAVAGPRADLASLWLAWLAGRA